MDDVETGIVKEPAPGVSGETHAEDLVGIEAEDDQIQQPDCDEYDHKHAEDGCAGRHKGAFHPGRG